MNLHTWLAFLTGVFLICGSPGPNMLLVMSSGAAHGLTRALATMAGCFIPVFLMICASVAGVGVLIKSFPALFDALRYAGAAYLAWIGLQAWRSPGSDDPAGLGPVAPTPQEHLFRRGLAVGSSNPKAMLFATAFFPQFLDSNAPQAPQIAILLTTFGVMEFSWYLTYASLGSRFQIALQRPRVRRNFNRATGCLFMAFGLWMALHL